MTQATAQQLLWMYETMLLIRRYEETMAQAIAEAIGGGYGDAAQHSTRNACTPSSAMCPHRRLGVPGVPILYSRLLELAVTLRSLRAHATQPDSPLSAAAS